MVNLASVELREVMQEITIFETEASLKPCFQLFLAAKKDKVQINIKLKFVSCSFYYQVWPSSNPVLHHKPFLHIFDNSKRLSEFKHSYLSQITTEN